MYLNKVMLIGNVGSYIKTTDVNGQKVTNFSIATAHGIKKEDEWENITTWHNIVAWNLSEYIQNSLVKGAKVFVEGRLTKRSYENVNKETKEIVEVIAEKVITFNKKDEETRAQKESSDDLPF